MLCLIAALAASVALTAEFVVRQAQVDEARPADAIIVFGAAEYAGRPSPVYRARLDHAYVLFQRGLAPMVITTGGAGADPKFSEGGVGRDYLSQRGIPDRCLIAETQGADTAESAQRVSAILHVNGMHTVVAVSDAYHIFRIKRLMRQYGIVAYGSPRPASVPHTPSAKITAMLRESASYIFWRLYPSWFPQ
ncbi:MAG: YdcF family protein [Acidobacteriia bacterium]|nr:YdcF family protein [Terriglobia bacterium]